MKLRHIFIAAMLAAILDRVIVLSPAWAHTGSPSPTTWSSGQTLTSTNLNDTIAHIHNTFSAGIVDAHINASAAIAHSKLATPALVPKAWGVVTSNCTGSAAAGTACTNTNSRVTGVVTKGSNGQYCVQLAYTPTDTAFVVQVTSHTAADVCIADTRSTGGTLCSSTTQHFLVKCFDYTGAAADVNQFSFTVLDDN
jgi:hypothetical protein